MIYNVSSEMMAKAIDLYLRTIGKVKDDEIITLEKFQPDSADKTFVLDIKKGVLPHTQQ